MLGGVFAVVWAKAWFGWAAARFGAPFGENPRSSFRGKASTSQMDWWRELSDSWARWSSVTGGAFTISSSGGGHSDCIILTDFWVLVLLLW